MFGPTSWNVPNATSRYVLPASSAGVVTEPPSTWNPVGACTSTSAASAAFGATRETINRTKARSATRRPSHTPAPKSTGTVPPMPERTDTGPFSTLLGFRVLSADETGSILEADLRPEHLNGAGIAHGGYLTSLLDSATGWAVHGEPPRPASTPRTSRISVQYVRAAVPGGTARLPRPLHHRRPPDRGRRSGDHPGRPRHRESGHESRSSAA